MEAAINGIHWSTDVWISHSTRSEPPCHPSSAAVPPEDKRKNIELQDTLPYRLSVTVCLSEHNGSSTKFEDIILQGEVLSSTIVL